MSVYKTEEEQVEDLKRWIKNYGPAIIGGVILALVLIYGWRFWVNHRNHKAELASATYETMLGANINNQNKLADEQADKLIKEHKSSPYASLAAFMLAKNSVEAKKYPDAIKHLQWILDNSSNKNFKEVARIRMARIQIATSNAKQALETLNKVNSKVYNGLVDEVRGDAYLTLNDKDKARKSYQKALAELPNADETRPILRMKFDNLAVANKSKQG